MSDLHSTPSSGNPEETPRILVAIDFSEDSRAALDWAVHYAERCSMRLVILHVVHEPASSPGFYRKDGREPLQPMQEVANSMMAEFLAQAKAENPESKPLAEADLRFVPGLPPTRIVEVSDLLGAKLTVVGSRGITGLPHMLLGSVAERVIELSPRPVVVVKAEASARPQKKDLKRLRKQQKKDRKRLKGMLGVEDLPEDRDDSGG